MRCHRQASVIAGTVPASTKLPCRVWLLALYVTEVDRFGVMTMVLHRQLGNSDVAAWRMRRRLLALITERSKPLRLGREIRARSHYQAPEASAQGSFHGRNSPDASSSPTPCRSGVPDSATSCFAKRRTGPGERPVPIAQSPGGLVTQSVTLRARPGQTDMAIGTSQSSGNSKGIISLASRNATISQIAGHAS